MQITTVSVEYKRRYPVAKYDSVEVSAYVSATLDEGETFQAVSTQLRELAREAVRTEILRVVKQPTPTVTTTQLVNGLPVSAEASEPCQE